jgi:Domain of unknown function (DUF4157)
MKTEFKQQRHSAARAVNHGFESQSHGQPLDSQARAVLEPRFGHNFGDVRVYADGQADQLAQDYQARAFTVGQDVYFRSGEYDPQTPSGMGLLAHELTHTIQQRGAAPVSSSLERDIEGEREAHIASSAVMNGRNASVTGSSPISVQCFQGPDEEWRQNKDSLERSRNVSTVQAIPGLGNILSASMAGVQGAMAGYDYLTGDTGPTQGSLYQRENVGVPKLNKALEDIWDFI